MRCSIPPRAGLSLLEVMIATGILAGSAIVLSSIIGTGVRFGNRAESRITAMIQATSILDETLARIAAGNVQEEYSGEITGAKPRSFEVIVRDLPDRESPATAGARDTSVGTSSRSLESNRQFGLVQVDVLLFDSNGQNENRSSRPIVHLTQVARRGPAP